MLNLDEEKLAYEFVLGGKTYSVDAVDMLEKMRDLTTVTSMEETASKLNQLLKLETPLSSYQCLRLLEDFKKFIDEKGVALKKAYQTLLSSTTTMDSVSQSTETSPPVSG